MRTIDMIVRYIQENGSITNMEGYEHLGTTKTNTRISEEPKGFFCDRWEDGYNRFGNPVRYKRYYLTEEGKRFYGGTK